MMSKLPNHLMSVFKQQLSAVVLLLLFSITIAEAQFTSGNLVVLQMGDGTAALASSGTKVFIKEYTTAGVAGITVNIPFTGSGSRLVMSGTAGSEGFLTRSADNTKIVFMGYDTTAGVASITTSSAANINRVIGQVDASGNYTRPFASASFITGSNPRSATLSGTNYWGAGGASGIC